MVRKIFLLLLLTGSLVALTGCPPAPECDFSTEGECYEEDGEISEEDEILIGEMEAQAFNTINQMRIDEGLNPLIYDSVVAYVAWEHSLDMATRNYLAHRNPEGLCAADRLSAAGISWSCVGEIIHFADGYDVTEIADLACREWHDSDSHRAILLNERYTHAGIGIYQSHCDRFYTTQVFLRYK